MSKVMEAIRNAITESGISRYRISKDCGIDQGQLSKLMSGQVGLGIENLEKLAEYLGLEIVIQKKATPKGKVTK